MSLVTRTYLSERALGIVSCGLKSVLHGFLLPQHGLVLLTLQVTDGQFKRELGILAITFNSLSASPLLEIHVVGLQHTLRKNTLRTCSMTSLWPMLATR